MPTGPKGQRRPADVIGNAARVVHDAQEQEKLAILRREINVGVEAAAAGRFSKKSVSDIMDEVMHEPSDV